VLEEIQEEEVLFPYRQVNYWEFGLILILLGSMLGEILKEEVLLV
jgi:exonuclease V gamma subunit